MITGEFYVLTVGKRYVRYVEAFIVGQLLEHAQRFESAAEAFVAKDKMEPAAKQMKKPVRAWKISIQEVE